MSWNLLSSSSGYDKWQTTVSWLLLYLGKGDRISIFLKEDFFIGLEKEVAEREEWRWAGEAGDKQVGSWFYGGRRTLLSWSNLWGTGKPRGCSVLGLEALEPGSPLSVRLLLGILNQNPPLDKNFIILHTRKPRGGPDSALVDSVAQWSRMLVFFLCVPAFFSSWVPSWLQDGL